MFSKPKVASLFTGLVEESGLVVEITHGIESSDFTVKCLVVNDDASIGDSICINGCCLTVVRIDENGMTFQAGSETLSKTNLGGLEMGHRVNLERALRAGDRLGGHYVAGHVDASGVVVERSESGDWAEFWFEVPEELTRQMAPKGSVTVDGVSLTLVEVQSTRFSVALIPHTLESTTLGDRKVGDSVNIETDILAKYVQQQLERVSV